MRKPKTHFEQIAVEVVKRIAQEDVPDSHAEGHDNDEVAVTIVPNGKLRPQLGRTLRKNARGTQCWKSIL